MKSKLNFIIDAVLFLLMGLLTGIGLLIKYVLLSGSERWIKYGQNVDLSYLGFDRHEWGKIHLIVALILIAFLILHILLHWKMIVCLYKKLLSNKGLRIFLALSFVLLTIFLLVFPFFIQPEIQEMESGKERFHSVENLENNIQKIENVKDETEGMHHHVNADIEVKGYMTIQEISDKYKIPCDVIKKNLQIPISTSNTSKLGHLRKQYDFKMSDVEITISKFKN
jgi:glucan phosphoethanolaminetransferase (alkaline phosphatase superfamily)